VTAVPLEDTSVLVLGIVSVPLETGELDLGIVTAGPLEDPGVLDLGVKTADTLE